VRKLASLTLTFLVAAAVPAAAHYNMLLPQTASAKKGEPVVLVYQWGHPFEHQLFDAPPPESLSVVAPDGRTTDLLPTLRKTRIPAGESKSVTAYRLTFTPDSRGDYVFVLKTPAIWMKEEGEFFQDTVKVVLHVQAQKGWDARGAAAFEILPLTRPYGLQPGMAFQAQVEVRSPDGKAATPALSRPVEIERYNEEAPVDLPPDEHVTRTAKPDPNGVVTGTLTDAGWWCITAARSGGMRERDGKDRPVLERSTLWVYVDEKPAR
jgi:cobalt/nickel transport protein